MFSNFLDLLCKVSIYMHGLSEPIKLNTGDRNPFDEEVEND